MFHCDMHGHVVAPSPHLSFQFSDQTEKSYSAMLAAVNAVYAAF
jgi:hypothetical protein